MKKYQPNQRKADLYDIGNGYILMNIVIKNDEGKIVNVDTYVGKDGQDYIKVGSTEKLDAPGTIFSYASHVKLQRFLVDQYIQIYLDNTKMRNQYTGII